MLEDKTPPAQSPAKSPAKSNGYIRAFVDYGGLAVFAIAYFLHLKFVRGAGPFGWTLTMALHGKADLIAATWWLVIGSARSPLAVGWIVEKRMAPMPLISGGFALVFGSLTLFFHDPRFIKIKPTVTNPAFAAGLFGGLLMRRNPLLWLIGDTLPLPEEGLAQAGRSATPCSFCPWPSSMRRSGAPSPTGSWVVFRFPGLLVLAVVLLLHPGPLHDEIL